MGLPAALLLLLLLRPVIPVTPVISVTPVTPVTSVAPVTPVAPCSALLPDTSEDLDLSNRSRGCAELDWSRFHRQRRLVLRHNGIEALSPRSRLGPRMEELDLAENRLRELPRGFFTNATALRSLRLEGNPLPAVPPSAFQPNLSSLSVSCRCDLLDTVLVPCSRSGIRCLCLTSQRQRFNITDFHGRECGSGAGLRAGLAGAAGAALAALGAAAAALRYRRRRAAAAVAGEGTGKEDPPGNLRQPRYISRDSGAGTAHVTDTPDYENVFVCPGTAPGWQEQRYSPQVLEDEDEDYFLESTADPGDQPIYANTLGPTEDIYIIPDQ